MRSGRSGTEERSSGPSGLTFFPAGRCIQSGRSDGNWKGSASPWIRTRNIDLLFPESPTWRGTWRCTGGSWSCLCWRICIRSFCVVYRTVRILSALSTGNTGILWWYASGHRPMRSRSGAVNWSGRSRTCWSVPWPAASAGPARWMDSMRLIMQPGICCPGILSIMERRFMKNRRWKWSGDRGRSCSLPRWRSIWSRETRKPFSIFWKRWWIPDCGRNV